MYVFYLTACIVMRTLAVLLLVYVTQGAIWFILNINPSLWQHSTDIGDAIPA